VCVGQFRDENVRRPAHFPFSTSRPLSLRWRANTAIVPFPTCSIIGPRIKDQSPGGLLLQCASAQKTTSLAQCCPARSHSAKPSCPARPKRFLCPDFFTCAASRNCSRATSRKSLQPAPRKICGWPSKQSFFLQELQLRCGFSAGQHGSRRTLPNPPPCALPTVFRANSCSMGRMPPRNHLVSPQFQSSRVPSSFLLRSNDAAGRVRFFPRTPPGPFSFSKTIFCLLPLDAGLLQSPPYQPPRGRAKSFLFQLPHVDSRHRFGRVPSHASRNRPSGSSKCVGSALHDGPSLRAARPDSAALEKCPEPNETPLSAPSLPHQRRIRRAVRKFRPPKKFGNRQLSSLRDFPRIRSSGRPPDLLCRGASNSSSRKRGQPFHLGNDRPACCRTAFPPRCRSRLRPFVRIIAAPSAMRPPPPRPGFPRAAEQTALDNRGFQNVIFSSSAGVSHFAFRQ